MASATEPLSKPPCRKGSAASKFRFAIGLLGVRVPNRVNPLRLVATDPATYARYRKFIVRGAASLDPTVALRRN